MTTGTSTLLLFVLLTVVIFAGPPLALGIGFVALVVAFFLWGPASLNMVATSTLGTMLSTLLLAIPLFILMAKYLEKSGLAEDLYDLMYHLLGRMRGGLGVGTVIICTIFAAMAGVTAAATVSMGLIALPSMLKRGYSKNMSIGCFPYGPRLQKLHCRFVVKVVAIDPEFAMAYRSMSAAYGNMGFRAKSDQYRQKGLEYADRISERERWLIEGLFYGRTEKTYDKAIEAYTKVLELYPDDPIANNMLGVIYSALEEPIKAVERYEICVKQRGSPYLYFGNLASAYEQLGKYGKARAVLEGYLKTNPETGAAHRDLAGCYLSEGKNDLAIAEADRAFALAPSDFGIYATLGQAAMLKGDFARAEAEIKRLTESAVKAGQPWRWFASEL